MKKIFPIIMLSLILSSCHINDLKVFKGSFVYFNEAASSSTVINSKGTFTGEYMIQFTSEAIEENLKVTVKAHVGDGLKEGVDFQLLSPSELTFYPGVYKLYYRVKWLPHQLDPSKDNTITLEIESASDPNVTLGVPGPSQKYRTIKLTKNN